MDKPYDLTEVADRANNIQKEVELGRKEFDIMFHWNTISNLTSF